MEPTFHRHEHNTIMLTRWSAIMYKGVVLLDRALTMLYPLGYDEYDESLAVVTSLISHWGYMAETSEFEAPYTCIRATELACADAKALIIGRNAIIEVTEGELVPSATVELLSLMAEALESIASYVREVVLGTLPDERVAPFWSRMAKTIVTATDMFLPTNQRLSLILPRATKDLFTPSESASKESLEIGVAILMVRAVSDALPLLKHSSLPQWWVPFWKDILSMGVTALQGI